MIQIPYPLRRIVRLIPVAGIAAAMTIWTALVPSADAEAPSGHFQVRSGTVEDSGTKLVWQQAFGEAYTWSDAVKYCKTLELDGSGWRLPSVKELLTLVDESTAMPAIDQVVFPDVGSEYFWTSTTVANFASNAWAVSFAYGIDNFFDVSTPEHVRCVR